MKINLNLDKRRTFLNDTKRSKIEALDCNRTTAIRHGSRGLFVK